MVVHMYAGRQEPTRYAEPLVRERGAGRQEEGRQARRAGGQRRRKEIHVAPPPLSSLSRINTAELSRASEAPEVVPGDGVYSLSPKVDEFSEKLPSPHLQPDYNARLLSLPGGMENIWAPLTRPAMHNRYHGFCKGAWQIRKTVRDA